MESLIGRIGRLAGAALRMAGRWTLRVRVARAVREAERVREATGLRMMVFRLNGKVRVAPKRTVKGLVRSGRFRRGMTVRDIERNCLYITK